VGDAERVYALLAKDTASSGAVELLLHGVTVLDREVVNCPFALGSTSGLEGRMNEYVKLAVCERASCTPFCRGYICLVDAWMLLSRSALTFYLFAVSLIAFSQASSAICTHAYEKAML
jgi:hypothetical protein